MKKNLLFVFCLITLNAGLAFAQSFSIPSSNYDLWTTPTANLIGLQIPITNSGSSNIDVLVEKTVNITAPMHSSLFCFGISCYDSSYSSSAVIPFASHATETLMADLNCNFTLGESWVTYRIKDVNNPSDFAEVQVGYHVTTTGIAVIEPSNEISVPSPNPADKFAAISYDLKGNYRDYKIAVYNMLGKLVKEYSFNIGKGVMLLPASELNSGIYFYSLVSGNKVISTNKLIVSHKN